MSDSRKRRPHPEAEVNFDAEIAAMVDRVRQIFGDEVLAAVYDRARNAAIRQTPARDAPAPAGPGGRLRLVSSPDHDGFARALRDELDRALTHH